MFLLQKTISRLSREVSVASLSFWTNYYFKDWKILYVTEPSRINFQWIILLYALFAAGEVITNITVVLFCYTEGPVDMKPFTLSLWYLQAGFGKIIVHLVRQIKLDKSSNESLVYAGLMIVSTSLFMVLSWWYYQAQRKSEETVKKL